MCGPRVAGRTQWVEFSGGWLRAVARTPQDLVLVITLLSLSTAAYKQTGWKRSRVLHRVAPAQPGLPLPQRQ